MCEGNLEVGSHMARVTAQHNNPVGEKHRFFDIVRHNKNGAGGYRLLLPQLKQLAAKVFGRQHVERGERLVHEEYFRLDNKCAGKADALAHSAGELLGICRLEAVEADRVQHLERALATVGGLQATSLQRGFHILDDRQPWKQGEALEDDGYIDVGVGNRFFMPVHLARRGRRKPRQHTQQGRFARSRGAEQRNDLAFADRQIGRRDDLNPVLARLRVVFLDLFGTNNDLLHRIWFSGDVGLMKLDQSGIAGSALSVSLVPRVHSKATHPLTALQLSAE